MITKDELKKEVDKLPESLLEEVYSLLKKLTQQKKVPTKLTPRNFQGTLDKTIIRNNTYE